MLKEDIFSLPFSKLDFRLLRTAEKKVGDRDELDPFPFALFLFLLDLFFSREPWRWHLAVLKEKMLLSMTTSSYPFLTKRRE